MLAKFRVQVGKVLLKCVRVLKINREEKRVIFLKLSDILCVYVCVERALIRNFKKKKCLQNCKPTHEVKNYQL